MSVPMSDGEFLLDRFAFAAETVRKWCEDHGRDKAEAMVAECATNDGHAFSEQARLAFLTAFGL